MFTEEMVEYTYGVLTDNDDFIHIDFAVLMTLGAFGFDSDDESLVSAYHKYYDKMANELGY